MARAAFNDTVFVYDTLDGITPNVIIFSRPGRFVPETRTNVQTPAIGTPTAYVNYNGPSASAGSTTILPPTYLVDATDGHFVEMLSNPGTFYQVIRTEIITPPFGRTPYRRLYVTG